eukprot:9705274-Prorocentrum_lima.AAC.1
MTSSLVGSEMCIRDRAVGDLRQATIDFGIEVIPCAGGLGVTAPVREVTVSYTHLTLPTICSV